MYRAYLSSTTIGHRKLALYKILALTNSAVFKAMSYLSDPYLTNTFLRLLHFHIIWDMELKLWVIKGVSSSVAHKKGGFLGFFLNMKTARETNDLLHIFEHIFIQQ